MVRTRCSFIMLNTINNCFMSLKEEDRQIMVSLELEKADSIFSENVGLTEKG